jgi:glycosyltransferase involved in cell wall biosynthesis
MFLVWRVFYAFVESAPVTAAVAIAMTLVRRLLGDDRAEGLLALADRRLVHSGWPYHSRGWTNLHMARWLASIRRWPHRRHARRPRCHPIPRTHRLRVGIIGPFSGLLSFPASLFRGFPSAADLTIFDFSYDGRYAAYLEPLAAKYIPMNESSSSEQVSVAARIIDAEQIDLLINTLAKRPVSDLLDRLHGPCRAHYCNGSEPLYHDNIDFQLYPQPEADYFVRGGRLFSTTTVNWFSQQRFFSVTPYYDVRELSPDWPCWGQREPLITYHGSLYKLASPAYLAVLFALLREDRALRFVFMGKDNGSALSSICDAAAKHDVASQVRYVGQFSSTRNADGVVDDHGWAKMRQLLARSRLAANPWPLGGGSARIEAYASGVPCIGVRLSFDKSLWNRPQLVVCDVPAIHAAAGTAWSAEEYIELCRKCLRDKTFFERVVRDQRTVLATLTDSRAWWRQVFDAYAGWMGEATSPEQFS